MRKRMRAGSIAAAAALAMLVTGCNPFSGQFPGNPAPAPYFIQHLSGGGTYPLSLDLGDQTRDVYLTFVNPNLYDAWGSLTVSGSMASIVPEADTTVARPVAAATAPKRAPTPAFITEYNQNPFGGRGRSAPSLRLLESGRGAPLLDTEGSSAGGTFYNMDLSDEPATCRKVVKDVDIGGGETRTLNIWVADNCWDDPDPLLDGDRLKLVNQTMVDAMAAKFLSAGAFNDIYDWVTAMLGAEWGTHGDTDLILPNDEITIFLCDIANDNVAGGYVGYFWSKDNTTTEYEPESSERVMFTIDAVSYATGTGSWDPTDPWPEDIYSTLAHEFQHMIHFYQREVLRDAMASGDTWINEMASLVVEDLLADKMAVIGPRGVDTEFLYPDGSAGAPLNTEGQLPLFINYPGVSLSEWGYDLESYSVAYAFGAWLARNYGGARLLSRLMQCPYIGRSSIEYLVSQETGHGESFDRIMQRWSAAALLSSETDAPFGYRYNTGGFFTSTVNGNTYRLGSIDLFNYKYEYSTQVGPRMYPGGTAGTYTVGTSEHLSTSIALYDATPVLQATGVLEWTLAMPEGLIATVVVK